MTPRYDVKASRDARRHFCSGCAGEASTTAGPLSLMNDRWPLEFVEFECRSTRPRWADKQHGPRRISPDGRLAIPAVGRSAEARRRRASARQPRIENTEGVRYYC